MRKFKYETHLHTNQSSACGITPAADYIEAYYNFGYSGIFVTDHFFNGNICYAARDTSKSWEERVDIYCKGYETALAAAKAFNERKGLKDEDEFKVFFGFEMSFDHGDDYLVYGLDKNWIKAHPEITWLTQEQVFEEVNKANGLMIQAHPFRFRSSYMSSMRQKPFAVHGIEIYNAGNYKMIENDLAELYAKAFDFPVTSGTDIHNVAVLEDPYVVGGMAFTSPLKDVFDYARRIKNYEGQVI